VALFVLMIVVLIAAQTWRDWRDSKKDWVVPEWAKGLALAGLVAVSMAAATSYASYWIEDGAGQASGPSVFWPEFGVMLCAMGVIVAVARKKRLPMILALGVLFAICLFLGITFNS
jgi:polyferredoxin